MCNGSAVRIRDWLLRSPVQVADGPERGAIAGWLDEDGRPSFAYGEITGYYLTWAGFAAREVGPSPELIGRSELALEWLERRWRDGVPPTRCLLTPGVGDWRNAAVFTFDLAMMLRGLGVAAGFLSAKRCREVAARVVAQLELLVDDEGCLASHRLRPGVTAGDVPDTWSTRTGPHLVKAAAAVLCTANLPVPDALRAVARRTVARWRTTACGAGLHPELYRLEGLLLLDGKLDSEATAHAEDLLGRVLAAAPEAPRGDVLAQALRLCSIVRRQRRDEDRWKTALPELRNALARHCDATGAVCFRRADRPSRHCNAWASMFADQALRWCDGDSDGAVSAGLLDMLV